MILVERGEVMTKYTDMTPAARFFHDLAAEAYTFRRRAVIRAYKAAVAAGKTDTYRWLRDANERSPLRCYLAALLTQTQDIGGTHWPIPVSYTHLTLPTTPYV